VVELGNKGLPN